MNKKSSKQKKSGQCSQYESIFQNNHTVMMVIEPETGLIVDANPAAYKFYQYPLAELIGMNIAQINILPMDEIKAEMERARSEARNYFNFRHRLANGEVRDVEVYSGPILYNDRQLLYSVIHDSTQRIKVEASFHQKTLELNNFFEVSIDLMVIASIDGYFLRLNNAWEKTLGYQLAEIQQSRYLDFVHPDDVERTKAAMAELANQKPVKGFVNRYRHKDGSYRWIEWHTAPMGNMVFGSAQDITEQKEKNEEIYRSREMLKLVLDTIPDRVFWKDISLKYMGCNKSFAVDRGFADPVEVIGKTDYEINKGVTAEKNRAVDQEVIRTGKPKYDYEELEMLTDDKFHWVRKSKVPLREQNGEIFGVMGTYADISEQKRSEELMKETNGKLTLLVADLEKRNHDASVLREMDEMLLSCNAIEEAYAVMDKFAPMVFQGTSGAIYLVDRNHKQVKKVSAWGEQIFSEVVFGLDECWALRLKKAHQWNKSNNNLPCKHVDPDYKGQYIDLPLVAAGDVLGLIHLEWQSNHEGVPGGMELMHNVMEQLTLTISNIKLRQELTSLSIRDHLTGLFNRRFMEEYLQKELLRAHRNHTHAGIVFLDIDNFKLYNDTYGHKGGDAVLKGIGSLLLKKVRGGDIASRIGGEEFVIILSETDLETTIRRAEQISEAIRTMHVELNGNPLGKVTVSAGISAYPDHGMDLDSLLDFADRGLYKAKRNGRDRVELAEEV